MFRFPITKLITIQWIPNPLRYELMMNEKEGDKGLQDVMMTQDYFSFSSFTIFSIVSPNSNVTG